MAGGGSVSRAAVAESNFDRNARGRPPNMKAPSLFTKAPPSLAHRRLNARAAPGSGSSLNTHPRPVPPARKCCRLPSVKGTLSHPRPISIRWICQTPYQPPCHKRHSESSRNKNCPQCTAFSRVTQIRLEFRIPPPHCAPYIAPRRCCRPSASPAPHPGRSHPFRHSSFDFRI